MAKEKNNIDVPSVNDGDLSERLISIREGAGYSMAQMADALCLSEQVITNLENEDFDQLADPPYIRGYIRNYAKLGETDSAELITVYESLRGADASELDFSIKKSKTFNTTSRKRISPIMGQLLLLALLLIGIGSLSMIPAVNKWVTNTWESLSTQFSSPNGESSDNPDLIGSLPVPIPLPSDDEIIGSDNNVAATINSENGAEEKKAEKAEGDSKEQQDNKSKIKTSNSDQVKNEVTQQSEDKPVENNIEEQSESTDTKQISIKLVFNKEVWMRIRDKDGKTLFEGINQSGTDKSLQFDKPITFRVGNAQGLSLTVDNETVDLSQYTNGSIANFTLE